VRPFHPKLITESALRAVVKEEIANQLLIEELNLLSEYKLRNFALDVAGLFPGVGEGADVINAVDLAKQGDYLSSAFSLISMIPVAGDVIGKGGKLAMLGSKAAQKTVAVGVAKVMPKAIKFFKVLVTKYGKKFPALKKLIPKLQKELEDFVKEVTGETVQAVAQKAKDVSNDQIKKALEKKDDSAGEQVLNGKEQAPA
tara:strand:- start:71 stop:667 length:597 start_codon:yes stop_codon:yes gene_type:complete